VEVVISLIASLVKHLVRMLGCRVRCSSKAPAGPWPLRGRPYLRDDRIKLFLLN
jgi:hypothetical protein